jgi:DNA-binding NarL/FixJ family response regulator
VKKLTLRQLQVLAAVQAGGSLADIAKRLEPKCSRIAVYNVVQRLAAARYLRLEPTRALTPKGVRALETAVSQLQATLRAASAA